jgi:hypothetical protein
MEGLDKGGLGPISDCCAIEEEVEGEAKPYYCLKAAVVLLSSDHDF